MGWHWPGVIVLLSWYDWTRPETDYIVCTIAIDCLLIHGFGQQSAYAKLQIITES